MTDGPGRRGDRDGPDGPVAVGVAGVGRLGREHARILSRLPAARLAGIHDVDVGRGGRVAEEVGAPHHASLDGLLERVEALIVAVPTVHHHAVARAALEAGCHVLVEKPLASTLEEADDLITRAGERGLELGVGHVERFNGAVRACEPHLDRPRFVESLRLAPFQARGTDVNVVLDLMIHDIDLILGLVGSRLDSVHAVGTPVLTDTIDIANARLVFEDGTVAEITASRVSEERTRVLRFFQRSGYLKLDLYRGNGEYLRRRTPGRGSPAVGEAAGAAPALGETGSADSAEAPVDLSDVVERIPLVGDGREPLELELESFLEAVRGRDSRLVSAREGRAALDVALRISREVEQFADATLETA